MCPSWTENYLTKKKIFSMDCFLNKIEQIRRHNPHFEPRIEPECTECDRIQDVDLKAIVYDAPGVRL